MSNNLRACRLRPRAERDLEDIWLYSFERWGQAQADGYLGQIVEAFNMLADGRKKGRAVDIRAGYLKHAVGSHMVYFRVMPDSIEIVRILHQRMDTEHHL
jgi:toxin ParE1/3/4